MSLACTSRKPAAAPTLSAALAVQGLLDNSPYWALRQLHCRTERDGVVLCGSVPSYYLKQLAHAVAAKAVGIEQVRDALEVELKAADARCESSSV